ncbi:hypothetical protein EON65_31715 [archaeon]|nr:MAG: hypothetical protein EON65_31715 [archaeon]
MARTVRNMQRKTGAVEIKLQSHVLSYKPASFLEKRDGNKLVVLPLLNDGNSKASTSSINKELVFTFDALLIPETNSTASTKTDVLEDVNSSLDKTFSTSIELLLLGYDATCLLYGSKQEIGDNDDNIKQLITRYCRLLYSKLQTTSPPIQSKQVPHNSILDNIQVSVYEILESQVRDLVSSSECRIRDGVGGQVILDGVSEHACTSYAAFESTLDKALLGRTHIALGESERGVAGHKLSALENIANVNYTILGKECDNGLLSMYEYFLQYIRHKYLWEMQSALLFSNNFTRIVLCVCR